MFANISLPTLVCCVKATLDQPTTDLSNIVQLRIISSPDISPCLVLLTYINMSIFPLAVNEVDHSNVPGEYYSNTSKS